MLYTHSLADTDKKSVFGGMMSAFLGIALFVIGVLLAIWATERLLEGLVGLSVAFRLSAFAVGAVLSGFEVENVAVGLAAGARGTAPIALGTVFGGAIFLVCVALGVSAVLYPLVTTSSLPSPISLSIHPPIFMADVES